MNGKNVQIKRKECKQKQKYTQRKNECEKRTVKSKEKAKMKKKEWKKM